MNLTMGSLKATQRRCIFACLVLNGPCGDVAGTLDLKGALRKG